MTATLSPGTRADHIRQLENLAREQDHANARVNVSDPARLASGLCGMALLGYGVRRGGFTGGIATLLGGSLIYRGLSGYCHLTEMLGVVPGGKALLHTGKNVHRGVKIHEEFTVQKTPEECYRAWRKFEDLPRFMTHLIAVEPLENHRLRWVAKAPVGTVSWEAEIINDKPGVTIAWRSVGESEIQNAGSVWFRQAPGGRGTRMTVELNYEPPAGRVGMAVARLFREEPSIQVREDLRAFKQILEAGETPTVDGQSSGRS